jgi:hypothetical protein
VDGDAVHARDHGASVLGLLGAGLHEGGTFGECKPKREALSDISALESNHFAGSTARARFTLSVLVRWDLVFATAW